REGDTGSEMYYILQGRILVQKQAGQIKKVLTDVGPGEYFGEMSTLIDAPRTASAEAASDSCLAVIDSETFHRMLRESDDVSLLMLRASSRRIKHTNEVLEELTEAWIELMAILYFLKEWPLAQGQDPVTELVRYTGKDPGDIREVLRKLGREGILRFEGDRVTEFVRSEAWKLLNHQVFG
ncbi:MAG: Crp/Fnr family transcriptional regulator, partial [Syntrophales bacterium]|nr:Crp/Fnr family transcriptional regulator [Syntrophales bacterium]